MHTDEQDFDATVITISFGADELAIVSVPAPISIIDDETNEAEEQFFIAVLRVANAINPSLVKNDQGNVAICTINDNDGNY